MPKRVYFGTHLVQPPSDFSMGFFYTNKYVLKSTEDSIGMY